MFKTVLRNPVGEVLRKEMLLVLIISNKLWTWMNVTHRDGLYIVLIIDISVRIGYLLSHPQRMFFGQAL